MSQACHVQLSALLVCKWSLQQFAELNTQSFGRHQRPAPIDINQIGTHLGTQTQVLCCCVCLNLPARHTTCESARLALYVYTV